MLLRVNKEDKKVLLKDIRPGEAFSLRGGTHTYLRLQHGFGKPMIECVDLDSKECVPINASSEIDPAKSVEVIVTF